MFHDALTYLFWAGKLLPCQFARCWGRIHPARPPVVFSTCQRHGASGGKQMCLSSGDQWGLEQSLYFFLQRPLGSLFNWNTLCCTGCVTPRHSFSPPALLSTCAQRCASYNQWAASLAQWDSCWLAGHVLLASWACGRTSWDHLQTSTFF